MCYWPRELLSTRRAAGRGAPGPPRLSGLFISPRSRSAPRWGRGGLRRIKVSLDRAGCYCDSRQLKTHRPGEAVPLPPRYGPRPLSSHSAVIMRVLSNGLEARPGDAIGLTTQRVFPSINSSCAEGHRHDLERQASCQGLSEQIPCLPTGLSLPGLALAGPEGACGGSPGGMCLLGAGQTGPGQVPRPSQGTSPAVEGPLFPSRGEQQRGPHVSPCSQQSPPPGIRSGGSRTRREWAGPLTTAWKPRAEGLGQALRICIPHEFPGDAGGGYRCLSQAGHFSRTCGF